MSRSKEQQTDAAAFRELVEEKQKRYKAAAGFGSRENHESADHSQRQHFSAAIEEQVEERQNPYKVAPEFVSEETEKSATHFRQHFSGKKDGTSFG